MALAAIGLVLVVGVGGEHVEVFDDVFRGAGLLVGVGRAGVGGETSAAETEEGTDLLGLLPVGVVDVLGE